MSDKSNDSSVSGTVGGGVFGYPSQSKPLSIPEFLDDSFEGWEDLFDDDDVDEPTVEHKCTCGGYKTYKSFAHAYHSYWCKFGENND